MTVYGNKGSCVSRAIIYLGLFCVFLVARPGYAIQEAEKSAPLMVKGVNPSQVEMSTLAPGLDCRYYLNFFKRHLKFLPSKEDFPGKQGAPILVLDHQFGKKQVFESGSNRGVGMRLEGYLHLEEEGAYLFQALSNDGIIVYIDGKVLISDPQQHADRLSSIGTLEIEQAGYYSVTIEYFQRKGTASLRLFWQKPGTDELQVISPDVYRHGKN